MPAGRGWQGFLPIFYHRCKNGPHTNLKVDSKGVPKLTAFRFFSYLEQDDAGVVHLAVVVVHQLLDALTVVHLGQVVALRPERVADLLDLRLDRGGLMTHTTSQSNRKTTTRHNGREAEAAADEGKYIYQRGPEKKKKSKGDSVRDQEIHQ